MLLQDSQPNRRHVGNFVNKKLDWTPGCVVVKGAHEGKFNFSCLLVVFSDSPKRRVSNILLSFSYSLEMTAHFISPRVIHSLTR